MKNTNTVKRGNFSLALILCLTIGVMPLLGLVCTKAQRDATCADVTTTLRGSEKAVLSIIPSQRDNYLKLEKWADEICAAVAAADNVKARTLIVAFLPVFDDVIGTLGVNQKLLALVDIGIHIVLNHLPQSTESILSGGFDVAENYRLRPVWGCKFKPEACKGL